MKKLSWKRLVLGVLVVGAALAGIRSLVRTGSVEPHSLRVRIVDPDGAPVPRVVLVVERGSGEHWREWIERVDRGEALVAEPDPGEILHLEVRDPRDADGRPLALLERRVEGIAADTREVVVTLPRGRHFKGRVVGPDAIPLAGVRLRAAPPTRYSAGRTAVSDDEGRFVILGLPLGALEVRVAEDERWGRPRPFLFEAGAAEVTIRIGYTLPFVVSVVDFEGAPVAGMEARVHWATDGSERDHEGATDEAGRITVPAPGRHTLFDLALRWQAGCPLVPDVVCDRVPFGDGAHTVRLPEPVTVSGVVVDAAGRPVPAGVLARPILPSDRVSLARPPTPRTVSELGAFNLDRLAPGRYRLAASSIGMPGMLATPVEVEAPAREIRLVLSPRVLLRGAVEPDDAADVHVQWFPKRATFDPWNPVDDGRIMFHVDCAAPGSLYALDRASHACALLEKVDPTAGPVAVRLVPGLEIRGRIDGLRPSSTKRLHAVRGPVRLTTRPAEDGSFRFTGIPAGPWRLVLDELWTPWATVSTEAGRHDVILTLPRGLRFNPP